MDIDKWAKEVREHLVWLIFLLRKDDGKISGKGHNWENCFLKRHSLKEIMKITRC